MTEPEPEPRGQRQVVPPKPPVAIGLQEAGQPQRPRPWRLAAFAFLGLLLVVAMAVWRFTRQ
jgi:hypothetical protein